MRKYNTVMINEEMSMNDNEVEIGNNILEFKTDDDDKKEERNLKIAELMYNCIKRVVDIIGAIVGIIILIPITIVVYILRKSRHEDDGPLFYEQLRIGKNGKYFRIYKFRTMCVNADTELKEYLQSHPDAKEEYDENKKLRNDPRITKNGELLRKTSLDELPQFINILKGEMSLVGPRPYLEREKKDMGDGYNKIIKMKPGLTGLWQISGRSELSFEERVNLDVQYYEKRSLIEDAKILLKTIGTVVKKEGAI